MRLKPISTSNGDRHSGVLWAVLCLFVLCLLPALAQKKVKTAPQADDRVYLVHSDELRYDQFGPVPDAQIVKGKVQFMHKGARMWCDSAYFYQQTRFAPSDMCEWCRATRFRLPASGLFTMVRHR